jgi:hypothetical protein
MGVDAPAGSGMQFDKVEGPGPAAPPACAQCRRPLDEYFALGGHMFCGTCVDGFRAGASFWRALLYGAGAAVLGTIVWFAILKLFNYELAIIGIVVGLFVGVAVRKGARGLGGWKFQALAMALTYVSITASYVPLVMKGAIDAAEKAEKAESAPAADGTANEGAAAAVPPAPSPAAKKPPAQVSGGAVAFAFLVIFGIALAMPFLAGASNFMGWIIIGIALYEAWKLNRRLPITGPLRFGGGLSVPAPAPVTPPGMPPPAAVT